MMPRKPVRLRTDVGNPRERAVFLDRDGVLNEVVGAGDRAVSPSSSSELTVVPGARSVLAPLRQLGWLLVVVTNQPDVARGLLTLAEAVAMTEAVVEAVGVDDAFLCVHDRGDECACRKPKAGLIRAAADVWGIDTARSWLFGDRWVDVGAAAAAGARSILLERPYSWDASGGVGAPPDLRPDHVVETLADAVAILLEEDGA
jgi:D-glycero-D-manno-heptose 1,7-bisphosphate phosphatase